MENEMNKGKVMALAEKIWDAINEIDPDPVKDKVIEFAPIAILGFPVEKLDFQQRLAKEKRELDVKANALSDFIANNNLFIELAEIEKEDMMKQRKAMREYSEILGRRICRL